MGKNAPTNAGCTPENLERVSGIGPKTAEALAQIGVRHLTDLAQSTPDALAKDLFEQVGLRVSPERIEAMNWIGQALALLQQIHDEQALLQPPVAIEREPVEMPAVEGTANKPQWPQYAGFSLFFDCEQGEEDRQSWQTRIYHDETGDEVQFTGTASDAWLNWILKQAQLPADARSEPIPLALPAVSDAVTSSTATLVVLDVEIGEKPQLAVGGQKLVAEIRFSVTGSYAEVPNTANTSYQVLMLAVDQNRDQSKLIASEQGILPTQHAIHRHELEFPILDLGRYELLTIVLVQGQMELVANYRGPIVTVVPKPASD